MEHVEEAGVHSGDSACSIPPTRLAAETVAVIEDYTRRIAEALEVKVPFWTLGFSPRGSSQLNPPSSNRIRYELSTVRAGRRCRGRRARPGAAFLDQAELQQDVEQLILAQRRRDAEFFGTTPLCPDTKKLVVFVQSAVDHFRLAAKLRKQAARRTQCPN